MGPGCIDTNELKETDFDLPAERGTRVAVKPHDRHELALAPPTAVVPLWQHCENSLQQTVY